MSALIAHMDNEDANAYLLRPRDIKDVKGLLGAMSNTDNAFVGAVKSKLSYEGKRLFDAEYIEEKSADFLVGQLIAEFNLILESSSLYDSEKLAGENLSEFSRKLIEKGSEHPIQLNRRLLEDSLWSYVERKRNKTDRIAEQDRTILDVIFDEDIRHDFVAECQNLITFGITYDNLIGELVSVARQAHESRALPADFIQQLIDKSISEVSQLEVVAGQDKAQINQRFAGWVKDLSNYSRSSAFLKSVEEWIRVVHKDKSDTLFVVVSFFFEKLLPEYYASKNSGKRYEGKIEPVRIGRRKDFWNRLNIAYRDLLFHEQLTREKRSNRTTYETLLEKYVNNFTELNGTLMSANPVAFPTFRPSIESALKNNIRPSGLITGLGDFTTEKGCYRVGLVMSNVAFQAGSIDNSDCVRFCKLLVECA